MSVTSAMYTGVSGLLSNSEAMNVIGNNISNVNTVGFKSGRSVFADMLSDNIGSAQVGTGSQLQAVSNLFTQGSALQTGNVTDLSIAGNSFFALKEASGASPVGSQDAAFLTRAGAFHVDGSLTLVNPDGFQVLDTQGNPIRFVDTFPDAMSTFAGANSTLNSAGALAADLITVGGLAGVDATLVATASDAADAAATAAAAFANNPSESTAATLSSAIATAYAAMVDANNSAGTPAALTTTAADVATMSADAAAVTTAWQTSFGNITKIGQDGLITYLGKDGVTENYYNTSGAAGVTVNPANAATVQRIAVVSATDVTALQKVGGSLFKCTPGSGVSSDPFSLSSNKANNTSEKILSNTLESSNVDMANEFVNMITTQRAYSANSKTITTTDQMTQEVLQLIR